MLADIVAAQWKGPPVVSTNQLNKAKDWATAVAEATAHMFEAYPNIYKALLRNNPTAATTNLGAVTTADCHRSPNTIENSWQQ